MTPPPSFRHYLSLGDSISIDLYPGLDIQEREGLSIIPGGLGAASLLHQNREGYWPAFEGQDLVSRFPGIRHLDLTADGATTRSTLHGQLPRVPADLEGPVLVTLTVGGNDLVELLGADPGTAGAGRSASTPDPVPAIAGRLAEILRGIGERLPDSTVLVGDVYDPSDGTADLGDGVVRTRALSWLTDYNRRVRELARDTGGVPIPIHDHFMGHGLTEPDPAARWYWSGLIIEPSARGASEVRRLWVEALGLVSR